MIYLNFDGTFSSELHFDNPLPHWFQQISEDIQRHGQPVTETSSKIDTFNRDNATRLSRDQQNQLSDLSDTLRTRYDDLTLKSRRDLTDAEEKLRRLRAEQEESVSQWRSTHCAILGGKCLGICSFSSTSD